MMLSDYRMALAAMLLVACGGAAAAEKGKPTSRPWGAVAYNTGTGVYGYAVDYSTRRAAETEAFSRCGQQCDVIKSFRDTCGAVAGKPKRYVWDTGSSREIAEMKALRKCGGGGGCSVLVWACTTQKQGRSK